ncbi:hypothetical protein ACP4OV_031863 [Aristida adscensionis]
MHCNKVALRSIPSRYSSLKATLLPPISPRAKHANYPQSIIAPSLNGPLHFIIRDGHVECPPKHECTETISLGTCDSARCLEDCLTKYHGMADGGCFPENGCVCTYCCDRHEHKTT